MIEWSLITILYTLGVCWAYFDERHANIRSYNIPKYEIVLVALFWPFVVTIGIISQLFNKD